MAEQLPLRKFIKVWIKKRKNNPQKDGTCTTSYTLEWIEYGERRFMSLGKHATLSYARQAAADKQKELNSSAYRDNLDPILWDAFVKKYLDTAYPGHGLPRRERKAAEAGWSKSLKSMLSGRRAMNNFARLVVPNWCHEITSAERERFVMERLSEVPCAASVDADLRALRAVFNVMEEWKHRAEHSNPFAGRGKASVGVRRKRAKELAAGKRAKYFTRSQILALLDQADKEVIEKPNNWDRHRLRALVYFEAYTGTRIGEALHLEWDKEIDVGNGVAKELDLDLGVAFLNWKIEHGLKTAGSEAPIGLPDALVTILRGWRRRKTSNWVFPNSDGRPWIGGGPGYRHLDQLKSLAERARVGHATWKMFRHSLSTHGKQWFGMSQEQTATPRIQETAPL
jgi:integrase